VREGFHAFGGWSFRRDLGGYVAIEVAESDHVDAPLRVAAVFDPDTWASIVASVSHRGDSAETWRAVRLFHQPAETPPRDKGARAMDFGQALARLKTGGRLARAGWNGRGMYVVHQKGYPDGIPINANTAAATGIPQDTVCRFRPYLMLKALDDEFVPWVASQSDLLAEDWVEV
jgi:Protein of unknown function (DUF2829)